LKKYKNVVWINTELSNGIETGDESTKNTDIKDECKQASNIDKENIDTMFSKHMSEYIGQTVTVYTTSAGAAGCGLTGVLLECTNTHLRLVTQIGPAPGKPKRRACRKCPYYTSCMNAGKMLQGVGSIAEIPLKSLVIFVHNSL